MTPRDLLIFGALIALGCIAGVVHLVDRHLRRKHEVRKVEVEAEVKAREIGEAIVQQVYLETLGSMVAFGELTRLGAVLAARTSIKSLERGQA